MKISLQIVVNQYLLLKYCCSQRPLWTTLFTFLLPFPFLFSFSFFLCHIPLLYHFNIVLEHRWFWSLQGIWFFWVWTLDRKWKLLVALINLFFGGFIMSSGSFRSKVCHCHLCYPREPQFELFWENASSNKYEVFCLILLVDLIMNNVPIQMTWCLFCFSGWTGLNFFPL